MNIINDNLSFLCKIKIRRICKLDEGKAPTTRRYQPNGVKGADNLTSLYLVIAVHRTNEAIEIYSCYQALNQKRVQ